MSDDTFRLVVAGGVVLAGVRFFVQTIRWWSVSHLRSNFNQGDRAHFARDKAV
jgi:hypothetical protein